MPAVFLQRTRISGEVSKDSFQTLGDQDIAGTAATIAEGVDKIENEQNKLVWIESPQHIERRTPTFGKRPHTRSGRVFRRARGQGEENDIFIIASHVMDNRRQEKIHKD